MTYPCAFTFLIKTFMQIALVNMSLIGDKIKYSSMQSASFLTSSQNKQALLTILLICHAALLAALGCMFTHEESKCHELLKFSLTSAILKK